MFPLGTKEEMYKLDQLFLRGKYHLGADKSKTLAELLAIPLDKKRKRTQSKIIYSTISIILHTLFG